MGYLASLSVDGRLDTLGLAVLPSVTAGWMDGWIWRWGMGLCLGVTAAWYVPKDIFCFDTYGAGCAAEKTH